MGKKVALNVLYNICIMLSLYGIYWGFSNKQYIVLVVALFIAILCVILKIGLIKEIRQMERPVPQPPQKKK
jgi:hypothetical protein